MKTLHPLRLGGGFVIAATLYLATPAQADLEYVLLPGSTITPYDQGHPTGPSEPMTGTFAWHQDTTMPGFVVFDATDLTFHSASFLLTLDTTIANDLGTSLFAATHTSYFGEIVNWGGLPGIPLDISGAVLGTFEGPLESPTRLMYSELGLFPVSGGNIVAVISFAAVQVPEPASMALLFCGALLLLAAKRPKGQTNRKSKSTRT